LVGAKGSGAVKNGTVAFRSETVFVGVTGDGGYALEAEIEEFGFETGFFEKGNEKGSEAAVYVKRNLAFKGEFGEGGDVVDDSMGEVWGRTDEENCVAVY
jgi:hypothetical protein